MFVCMMRLDWAGGQMSARCLLHGWVNASQVYLIWVLGARLAAKEYWIEFFSELKLGNIWGVWLN
jgi:hypothetical protein